MFEQIQKSIETLLIDYPEKVCLISDLNNQKWKIFNSDFTEEEVKTFLKEDNDILDDIDQDSAFYEDVRNIQDMLILFKRND